MATNVAAQQRPPRGLQAQQRGPYGQSRSSWMQGRPQSDPQGSPQR